jgi:hypothetical protein
MARWKDKVSVIIQLLYLNSQNLRKENLSFLKMGNDEGWIEKNKPLLTYDDSNTTRTK